MLARIRSYYEFERWDASFRTEIMGGLTTFMTMAYIIFVNPAILAQAGMDFNAVLMATCLASAAATVIMALWARYPIALAPGMGMNAFFTFEICLHYGVKWPVALGMVAFLAAVLFFILTLVHVREVLINAIPPSIKHATACGIGFFIALIGLHGAGLVVPDPDTMLRVGDLSAPAALISLAALAATALLMAARVRGAILFGIIIAGTLGLLTHVIAVPPGYHVLAAPPSLAPTAFKFELAPIAGRWELIALVFILLFFMLFDTLGTLIGVAEQAGFLDPEGRLPRANRALMADAGGAMIGSLLGTSTVTCYIESATGVAAGARTGVAALTVAALFVLAAFFSPTVALFAKPFVTAPALIVVGCLMMGSVAKVAWREPDEALPAFLTMIIMPLGFSISKGMVAGLVSWPLLKLVAGKGRQVHPLMYGLAVVLAAGVIADYTLFAPATPAAPNPPAAKPAFADPALEAAVREALGLKTGPLDDRHLQQLVQLNAPNRGIRSLAGLERCTSLAALDLSNNDLIDLAPLDGLTSLTEIRIPANHVRSLAPLASLPNLRGLYFDDNQVVDLTPLASLPSLKFLSAARNQIHDLSPLAQLTALDSVDLLDNHLTDLDPLLAAQRAGSFAPGSSLRLSGNPLSDRARQDQVPQLKQAGVKVFP